MEITRNASDLSWVTNKKGKWSTLIKDLQEGTPVFSEGYTPTVTGKKVTITSASSPVGLVTYTIEDGNTVSAGPLYGAGTVSNSLEAVSGEKTVRMGSYTFTGNETWTLGVNSGVSYNSYFTGITGKKTGLSNLMIPGFVTSSASSWTGLVDNTCIGANANSSVYVKNDEWTTSEQVAAGMAGKTIYYELAEPVTSTETAQPMSLAQGSDTIGGGSFDATYEGTEYTIPLIRNCKYIHRDAEGNDTLVTGSTTVTGVDVKGGVDKLINLTYWFGRSNEPSVTDFYKLYPTWKGYDIPYNIGTILNYKGTGVQTIGFNVYNHATGTAELLGGHEYQICGTYTSVSYLDQWGDTEELELDDKGIFTPANNGTLTVVGGNDTDTCVHLTWSGYKNFGEDEYQWEPFTKNIHNIDVVQYFPDGMNGVEYVGNPSIVIADELHADKSIHKFGTKIFDGTETWYTQTNSHGQTIFRLPIEGKKGGTAAYNLLAANCRWDKYTPIYLTNSANYNGKMVDKTFCGDYSGGNSIYVYDATCTTIEQIQQATKGTKLAYELASPVVTQLPSPINLTYPVNDFGTEQSLPVNTTDLVTTDLHADIQYNTDYMRMNTQLSEIFPTVRSLAKQEQAGEIMKTDATAPNATVGNAYNLIDRNAAGTERQFSFDTAGGTQDIADGTAVAKKVMGTTLNLNQLVHDTNENTVESVDGNATVEDAVEGNVKHLVVSGDTVVVNQLVHEYVEKTESGTGRIWIKDAFEKEAKGLKVTAPRSVVVNQHINTTDTSIVLTNGHEWITYIDGEYELVSGTGQSISCTGGTDMAVDLTQYFNGDQELIDSIMSWNDLTEFDRAFSSYVSYNAGTVKGVTPALTLNGANSPFATSSQEMFGLGDTRDELNVTEGKFSKKISSIDLSTLTWTESSGVWTATLSNIKNNTVNVLSASYSGISVNGTAVSITSTVSPTGLLYYELATPIVTDVNSIAFDLVSHDNTIFQTSGDLQSNIEATYDGLNQTIELDSSHTYIFNHNFVDESLITEQTSIDVIGGEDMLVDLTQLYNGNTTRVEKIHSWASLSSRIHMYRDWIPYNPGEIVNLAATIRVYQHEHAYGVIYDPSQSSPVCQRVELNDGVLTEVESFTSLSAHEKFYRCVMDNLSTRHISYYLDDEDSTKKYNGTRNGVTSDGTSSVLTGADGDVMVEIPITYWSLNEDYNGTGKILWLVSDTPFTGSEIHDFFYVSPNGDEARTQYVGAYRAVVADAEGNALNTTEGAITQDAGTATTRLLRSVVGALPFNAASLAAMREAAVRNGGSHVNRLFHEYLLMMMTIEQASLNCQSISMGYSNGKTNALWAWRKSGRTNYGNGTGQTMAVANTNDDDNFYSLKVNNVQLYRDVDRDADGYFAWSNHAATPTVYWTESNAPGNGATAYSDSTGTDSGYVTASWSTTADANKVIQFQYRGIENPFGECWEFDDGVQKYQKAILTSIKVNNIVHYVNHLKDGTGTKTAWTSEDGTSTYWTTAVIPGNNSIAYSDSDCTIDSGYKITQNTFVRVDCEMWNTVSVTDYTSTDQHTTSSKAYDRKRHYWPSGSWIKRFDPRSFLPRTLGASGSTYLCDNWYNDNGTGSRVVFRGGHAYNGANVGLGFVYVYNGLTYSAVNISGRLSA